uniref:Uncharacterized protein n=1 Tax=Gouania willdenowi TaxID=441366 RepID=A0A8C5ETX5_GOUWI
MKTLSVFVAVAIVLTVMCSQQSSAVPVLQGEELEETIFLEIPDAAMDETVMDSMKVRACSNTPDSDLKLACVCVCVCSVNGFRFNCHHIGVSNLSDWRCELTVII